MARYDYRLDDPNFIEDYGFSTDDTPDSRYDTGAKDYYGDFNINQYGGVGYFGPLWDTTGQYASVQQFAGEGIDKELEFLRSFGIQPEQVNGEWVVDLHKYGNQMIQAHPMQKDSLLDQIAFSLALGGFGVVAGPSIIGGGLEGWEGINTTADLTGVGSGTGVVTGGTTGMGPLTELEVSEVGTGGFLPDAPVTPTTPTTEGMNPLNELEVSEVTNEGWLPDTPVNPSTDFPGGEDDLLETEVITGGDGGTTVPGEGLPTDAGTGGNWWDELVNTFTSSPGDIEDFIRLIGGVVEGWQTNSNMQDYSDQLNRIIDRMDPFYGQRPYYQDLLRTSYEDPDFLTNNPTFQAMYRPQQRSLDAKMAGMGMSQSGNALSELQRVGTETAAQYILPWQQTVGNFAGANISPSAVGDVGSNMANNMYNARNNRNAAYGAAISSIPKIFGWT